MTSHPSSRDDNDSASAPFDDRPLPDAGLPPVEPPSARFIVQLFVVPALIVAAVIGVYLLFGKLASSDIDWREHAADLRSPNPQVRWRAALGLAQLLEADSIRGDTEAPIASDPELAAELATTLSTELDLPAGGEEHDRLLDYLIKAVGWMDVPATVLPPLQKAMLPSRKESLRQQSLNSVAMVTGRAFERGEPIDDAGLARDLIAITDEPTNVLRNLAAFDLGLLQSSEATARLQLLLAHPDRFTQLQAAIGLTRQGSLEGLPVFEDILGVAGGEAFDPKSVTTEQQANEYFESMKPVTQAITAAADLRDKLSPEQRQRLIELIEPLTRVPDAELRHHAVEKLAVLKDRAM